MGEESLEVPLPDRGSGPGLVIGAVTGMNPGRWVRTWNERHRERRARVVVVEETQQREALTDGTVTMCFVRGPLPDPDSVFHRIPLFEETRVVAVPRDHILAEWESVELDDLSDETLLQPPDEVPGWTGSPEPALAGSALTLPVRERLRMVADGVGVLVLPMSVARLHSRRDVVAVPIVDLPGLPVGLAWLRSSDSDLTQEFVGVVRGRTPQSSRGKDSAGTSAPSPKVRNRPAGRRRRG